MFPSPSSDHDLRRARAQVLLAGICALVLSVGLSRFAYTPLLPVMRQEAGLSVLAGGWLAALNYLGYISGILLAAGAGGLYRKYQLYRLCLVLAVLSTLAMGLTENLYLWAWWRYVGGFSSIAGLLLASGLVLDWLRRHGQRPELGVHFTGMGIGIIVSGLAVGAMTGVVGWDTQWVNLGLLGALFFVPAWCWLPAPPKTVAALADAPAPTSRRWLGLMIAAYFCAGVGYVISATFIIDILERLPPLAGRGGWVWLILGVAALPSAFLWDRIAQRFGQIAALLLAYALQTFSILLPALTTDTALNLLSTVLYGGTFVGIVSLSLSLVGRRFPHNPARAMARLTLSYGLAQIAAPALAGYLASLTGSYRGALFAAAGAMLAGMLLLGLLARLREAEPAP